VRVRRLDALRDLRWHSRRLCWPQEGRPRSLSHSLLLSLSLSLALCFSPQILNPKPSTLNPKPQTLNRNPPWLPPTEARLQQDFGRCSAHFDALMSHTPTLTECSNRHFVLPDSWEKAGGFRLFSPRNLAATKVDLSGQWKGSPIMGAFGYIPRCDTPELLSSFFITLKPGVERYKSLCALNTSPPRNRFTFLRSSCSHSLMGSHHLDSNGVPSTIRHFRHELRRTAICCALRDSVAKM